MQAKIQKFDCVTHSGSYLALVLEGPDVSTAPSCVRQILRAPSSMYPKTADHLDDHAAMEAMFVRVCNMINAYPELKRAAEELEESLEWLRTGKIDGVSCNQQQLVENISRSLARLQI